MAFILTLFSFVTNLTFLKYSQSAPEKTNSKTSLKWRIWKLQNKLFAYAPEIVL